MQLTARTHMVRAAYSRPAKPLPDADACLNIGDIPACSPSSGAGIFTSTIDTEMTDRRLLELLRAATSLEQEFYHPDNRHESTLVPLKLIIKIIKIIKTDSLLTPS
jgi:hypothetical protein